MAIEMAAVSCGANLHQRNENGSSENVAMARRGGINGVAKPSSMAASKKKREIMANVEIVNSK
jgi:intracellular sulfur oxidation DsrE/DsrF family protein